MTTFNIGDKVKVEKYGKMVDGIIFEQRSGMELLGFDTTEYLVEIEETCSVTGNRLKHWYGIDNVKL